MGVCEGVSLGMFVGDEVKVTVGVGVSVDVGGGERECSAIRREGDARDPRLPARAVQFAGGAGADA